MNTHQAMSVSPDPRSSISAPISPRQTPPLVTPEDRAKAVRDRQAKLAAWSTLTLSPDTRLRQKWADEDFMRDALRCAKVRIGSDLEPATAPRLRSVLRKAGIVGDVVGPAIGCSLERYLQLNPKLPLWAAVALVLEAALS